MSSHQSFSTISDILTSLARAIDTAGSEAFGAALVGVVEAAMPVDSALVIHYRRRRRPDLLYDGLANAMRDNSVEAYLAGAYLLDPFYLHSKTLTEPKLLRLRDIAPRDFEISEYFVEYYKRSMVIDEVNVIVPTDPGRSLALCIQRSAEHDAFTVAEMAGLADLQPAIAALLRAHDAAAESIGSGEATDREHERLEGTLQRFGSSVLTPREGQVMRLMLEGYSAPSLAKVLGLSVETVRVHRRNIYEKLRISSLGELFNLALRAVTTSSHGQALDPLVELKPDLAS